MHFFACTFSFLVLRNFLAGQSKILLYCCGSEHLIYLLAFKCLAVCITDVNKKNGISRINNAHFVFGFMISLSEIFFFFFGCLLLVSWFHFSVQELHFESFTVVPILYLLHIHIGVNKKRKMCIMHIRRIS